jgi:deoxyxylulose-5-phosphate synthase
VAEHRSTYDNISRIEDFKSICDVVVLSIGGTSQLLQEISSSLNKDSISNSYANVLWIKPFSLTYELLRIIQNAKLCVILDPEDTDFGISNSIKNELNKKISTKVINIGSRVGFPGYSKNLSSKFVDIQTVVDLIKRDLNDGS